jgi:hypothetical protein
VTAPASRVRLADVRRAMHGTPELDAMDALATDHAARAVMENMTRASAEAMVRATALQAADEYLRGPAPGRTGSALVLVLARDAADLIAAALLPGGGHPHPGMPDQVMGVRVTTTDLDDSPDWHVWDESAAMMRAQGSVFRWTP